MPHQHLSKTHLKESVSVALTFLLVLVFLPTAPPSSRVVAQTAGDIRPANILAAPAGSAYRVTHLASDIPGFAPVLDPLLVNPWGLATATTSPLWVANDGTGTARLVRGDLAGQCV